MRWAAGRDEDDDVVSVVTREMLLRDVKLRALQRRTVQPFLSGAAVLLKFQKRKVVLDWTHCRAPDRWLGPLLLLGHVALIPAY